MRSSITTCSTAKSCASTAPCACSRNKERSGGWSRLCRDRPDSRRMSALTPPPAPYRCGDHRPCHPRAAVHTRRSSGGNSHVRLSGAAAAISLRTHGGMPDRCFGGRAVAGDGSSRGGRAHHSRRRRWRLGDACRSRTIAGHGGLPGADSALCPRDRADRGALLPQVCGL